MLADENRAIDDWRVWRASTNNGGSLGLADPAPPATGLALNEFHFRSADGHVDWIEVRNLVADGHGDNKCNHIEKDASTASGTGMLGDTTAGDGIYTAQIAPGSFAGYAVNGAIIQFYVRATAANGEISELPKNGANAPGMWVVDSTAPATDLRRMRVVLSAYWADALSQDSGTGGHTVKFNYKFPKLANHYFPRVFIHNDSAIYYDASVRKTGSPFTRATNNSLDRARVIVPGDYLSRGKNGFFYNRSTDHKWMFIHWDSDNAFQTGRINDAVVGALTNVGTTSPGFFSKPFVRRYVNYYLNEMITTYAPNGPRVGAWITAEENASTSYAMPATYANWPTTNATSGTVQTRHQVIQNFIGATSMNAPFATTSPANNSSTAADVVTITGTAPTSAHSVICLGHPEAVLTWTSTNVSDTSPWSLTGVQLRSGANALTFRMLTIAGTQVGADIALTLNKTTNALPIAVVASEPSSQNVALGEVLTIDAIGSYDPEATPLTFSFAVSPASGFAMTSPSTASRNLIFTVPGTYTVTIQATDADSQIGTATRTYTVYNASDFDSFSGGVLTGYAVTNAELRDNYSPATWYSLNETSGSVVVQLTGVNTIPLRQTAPAFPLIVRALPTTADFALATNFVLETR